MIWNVLKICLPVKVLYFVESLGRVGKLSRLKVRTVHLEKSFEEKSAESEIDIGNLTCLIKS